MLSRRILDPLVRLEIACERSSRRTRYHGRKVLRTVECRNYDLGMAGQRMTLASGFERTCLDSVSQWDIRHNVGRRPVAAYSTTR